jgi:hypothetical protein
MMRIDLAGRERAGLIGGHIQMQHDTALLQDSGRSDGHRQSGHQGCCIAEQRAR